MIPLPRRSLFTVLQHGIYSVRGCAVLCRGEIAVHHEFEFFRRFPEEATNLFSGKWFCVFMLDHRRVEVLNYHHARNDRRFPELQGYALAAEPAADGKPTAKFELFGCMKLE